MDALWWFYTVVLGAAFTQIALAIALQIKTRVGSGVPVHWPNLLWQFFLTILTIEAWIAVGYFQRSLQSMSVLNLLGFLWVPMGILMLSVFLADQWWNGAAAQGDEERFNRLRPAFFTVLLLLPVVNLLHSASMGALAFNADLLFQLLIALGAVIGFFLRTLRADVILSAAMLAVITIYLFTSYGTITLV